MFGLGKLLILVAVVVAIWYGFKFVGRLDAQRRKRLAQRDEQDIEKPEEMKECPVCGTFVVSGSTRDCGRDGCPY